MRVSLLPAPSFPCCLRPPSGRRSAAIPILCSASALENGMSTNQRGDKDARTRRDNTTTNTYPHPPRHTHLATTAMCQSVPSDQSYRWRRVPLRKKPSSSADRARFACKCACTIARQSHVLFNLNCLYGQLMLLSSRSFRLRNLCHHRCRCCGSSRCIV